MGQLVGDIVQCGYHGMEYDCSGKCVKVPGPGHASRPRRMVRSFPVVERYNAIWIWMGDPERADPRTIHRVERYGEPGWAVIDGQYQHHRTTTSTSPRTCRTRRTPPTRTARPSAIRRPARCP